MKYGHFDDERKEYVITNPMTPVPWINYLGNGEFYSLLSNTGGGYSYFKDALLRRITRYRYNNVPNDDGGRYFYIRDGETVWNPGWKPLKTDLDFYESRVGTGYSIITGKKNELMAEATFFVPMDDNVELHLLRLKNDSKEVKKLSLYSFIEFNLWNALDDMTNFQRNLSIAEVEVDGSTIYHKTEYRERRNHYSFYHVNDDITGFDTDRESFLGKYRGLHEPQRVYSKTPGSSIARGWSPIASQQLDFELAPGEEKQLVFILGYVENTSDKKWNGDGLINKGPAKRLCEKYSSFETSIDELNKLMAFWEMSFNSFELKGIDPKLERMVNVWNPYQCQTTFHVSRSASFFESGIGRGIGFRDTNQDLLGTVHQLKDESRQRILDVAAIQKSDGSVYHQYQPLTKKGNDNIGGGFNDDPLWLILSSIEYIKETGDFDILEENIPFEDKPNEKASLLDHLKSCFNFTLNNLGPSGLPLIGRADWNDCLNLNCFSENPDESFQTTENTKGDRAESVMIAGMFVFIGKEYTRLLKQLEDPSHSQASEAIASIEKAVIDHGWDGDWYLRAYDSRGKAIGSHKNDDGKIFIEPQGFCAMAEIGKDKGYPNKALQSVKDRLDTEHGIQIISPAFKKYDMALGEITSYPPGYKENGGIFCHNNPWVVIAECIAGNGDRAFEYYAKINPAYTEDKSELHTVEPYVYCQMIAGSESGKPGEGKNSWLTGTAAWNYVAITQYILGIKADFEGLRIDPCIPKDWKDFSINRKFRDAHYAIHVANPNSVSKGIVSMTCDGKVLEGNIIPVFDDSAVHIVEVEMG